MESIIIIAIIIFLTIYIYKKGSKRKKQLSNIDPISLSFSAILFFIWIFWGSKFFIKLNESKDLFIGSKNLKLTQPLLTQLNEVFLKFYNQGDSLNSTRMLLIQDYYFWFLFSFIGIFIVLFLWSRNYKKIEVLNNGIIYNNKFYKNEEILSYEEFSPFFLKIINRKLLKVNFKNKNIYLIINDDTKKEINKNKLLLNIKN